MPCKHEYGCGGCGAFWPTFDDQREQYQDHIKILTDDVALLRTVLTEFATGHSTPNQVARARAVLAGDKNAPVLHAKEDAEEFEQRRKPKAKS